MLLTRENTTMRSLHVATREKPEQQQRPSPAKNKEIDTVIKTLGENLLLLACSGPFLFFQPGCSLMMTLVSGSLFTHQTQHNQHPMLHTKPPLHPSSPLYSHYIFPRLTVFKNKINSFLNHNWCKGI